MIRRPPRSTLSSSSAASDVYKRQQRRTRCYRDVTAVLVIRRDSTATAWCLARCLQWDGLETGVGLVLVRSVDKPVRRHDISRTRRQDRNSVDKCIHLVSECLVSELVCQRNVQLPVCTGGRGQTESQPPEFWPALSWLPVFVLRQNVGVHVIFIGQSSLRRPLLPLGVLQPQGRINVFVSPG